MAYLEYFDQRAIDLNSEIMKHPELMELLSRHNDPAINLSHVAAYCEIIVEGAYTEEECNVLAEILTQRLVAKRTGSLIVVP